MSHSALESAGSTPSGEAAEAKVPESAGMPLEPMLITKLTVSNYRSIVAESFSFERLGVLVGKNNVGKTNLLSAVALLLEGSSKSLTSRDYNDQSRPVSIEAEVHGVTRFLALCEDKHRARLEKCVLAGDVMRFRRSAPPPPEPLGKLEIWQEDKKEFGTPTGIEAGFKQLLPEVIHIEAFVDPASEAEGRDAATLGKILKVILEGVRNEADEAIKTSLQRVNTLLNVVEDPHGKTVDGRVSGLQAIERELARFLEQGFAGADARICVDLPELTQLLGKARVELDDGTGWTEARLKGQGQQRALYVALLRTLAQQKRSGDQLSRPFILLMEEPEVFLHPSAHVVLRRALESISNTNQVLFTTHSPTMVSPAQVGETILIRRKDQGGGKSGTRQLQPLKSELSGKEKRIRELFEYPRSSKFLFADKVFVVEGASDVELLEAMFVQLGQQSFDDLGLACVDASDKLLVKECMDILAGRGLAVYGVVDSDFLWRGCSQLLTSVSEYSKFRAVFWAECVKRGWTKEADETIPRAHRKDAIQLLADAQFQSAAQGIRKTLRDSHGIWVLEHGDIEDYAGLSSNAKGEYTRAGSEIRAGERRVNYGDEISELFKWAGQNLGTVM